MAKKPTPNKKAQEQDFEKSLIPKPFNAAIIERRFYDDFDDIYRFYHDATGKLELSEKQKEQLARWRFAREWMVNYEDDSDRNVVQAIMTEYAIGERQAYIDLKNTKRFFASMEPVQKEFEKVMMVERIRKTQKRLRADGSVKAEMALIKSEELLAKVMGLFDPEHTMPVPVVVEVKQDFDPAILGIEPIPEERLVKLLKAFGDEKEEKRRREIEDVDFEMIMGENG